MEVVNNNVESKGSILEYLKSISVNSSNIHEEFEIDNFITSVVMITTTSTTLNSNEDEYVIYLLFQDKKDNKIYGKFFNKKFTSKDEAVNYYDELKNKAKSLTNDDILNLI